MADPVNVLLMDSDIFLFQAMASAEEEFETYDGYWIRMANMNKAKAHVYDSVERIMDKVGGECHVVMCLTDDENFRKDVLPTYKGNRKGVKKPVGYVHLREWLIGEFETYVRPKLEADDCMGILATWQGYRPNDRKIIVSEDKDMITIGGWLMNPAKDDKPRMVTVEEANNFFLQQVLAGDATDGYGGCPNIGMETAAKIIEEPYGWEQYDHTFKSGQRKGETEKRWRKTEVNSVWEAIVAQYRKAGLNETAAIEQARCARILRACDYNFKKKEVVLWTP